MEFTFKSLQKLARTNAFLQRQLLALHGMDPRYFRPHQSSFNTVLQWVLKKTESEGMSSQKKNVTFKFNSPIGVVHKIR